MSISPHSHATISDVEFRDLFRNHPNGVAIVTLAEPGGRPVGFTATSVISVSAEPAVLGFVIAGTSSAWPALREATSVVVNFLDSGAADLSTRFATPGIDRFAGVPLRWLPTGEPVLTGALSWTRAAIRNRHEEGGSYLVTASVTHAQIGESRSPLVFHDRAYHQLDEGSRI